MFSDTANNRYTIQTAACFTLYGAVNWLAMGGLFDGTRGPAIWALGLAVVIPIAAHIWATLALIRSGDEFAKALTAKRFILAWGICMVVFCAMGFLASYAGTPSAPGWLLYPLFWLAFALVSPFVQSSR